MFLVSNSSVKLHLFNWNEHG